MSSLLLVVCVVVVSWLAPVRAVLALGPAGDAGAAGAGVAAAAGAEVAAGRAAGASAAAGTAGAAGRWVAPVAGPVVVRRSFAPPRVRWAAGHRGVDLASRAGAVVRAAGAGRLSFAGVLAGRGVLVVTHGALRTTYEPVRGLLPSGTAVAAGQAIALLEPAHPGPARPGESLLHWGLLRGATYLDPLSLLPRGPSRLVPVAPAEPPRGAHPRAAPAPDGGAGDGVAAWPAAPAPRGDPAPAGGADDSPAARAAGPALVDYGTGAGSLAAVAAGALAVRRARRVRRVRRVSPSGRRACRGAGGPPSCASGRSGSRSRPAPGRSPPA